MSITFKLPDGEKPKFLVVSVTPSDSDLETGIYVTLIVKGPFETPEEAAKALEKYFDGVTLHKMKALN